MSFFPIKLSFLLQLGAWLWFGFLNHAYGADEVTGTLRVGLVAYDDVRGRAKFMTDIFQKIELDRQSVNLEFAEGTAEEVLDWITTGELDLAVLSPGAFAMTDGSLTSAERKKLSKSQQYPRWRCRYLITPSLPPTNSEFASDARRSTFKYVYEPVCLISKRSLEDMQNAFPEAGNHANLLKAASEKKLVHFVFGDPLSLSGTIYPSALINTLGIKCTSWELSYSHNDTLSILLQDSKPSIQGDRPYVIGFVYDATVPKLTDVQAEQYGSHEEKEKLQKDIEKRVFTGLIKLELGRASEPAGYQKEINSIREMHNLNADGQTSADDLPAEVWVVRDSFSDKSLYELRGQLLKLGTDGHQFSDQSETNIEGQNGSKTSEVRVLRERVNFWMASGGRAINLEWSDYPTRKVREIFWSMNHYDRRFGPKSKLALVLSGGGAKCAYQAGAIAGIEQEIMDYNGGSALGTRGIDVVVGTSGGSINAVPTAMGITRDPNKASRLGQLWTSLQLTDILRPHAVTRLGLGFSISLFSLFGALSFLSLSKFVFCITKNCRNLSRRTYWRGLYNAWICYWTTLALFSLGIWVVPDIAKTMAPNSPILYYLVWLPLWFGSPTAFCTNLALAFGGCVLIKKGGHHQRKTGLLNYSQRFFHLFSRLGRQEKWKWRLLFSGLAVMAAVIVSVLFAAPTISTDEGLRSTALQKLEELIKDDIKDNKSRLSGDVDASTQHETYLGSAISQRITKYWDNEDRYNPSNSCRDLILNMSILGGVGSADRSVTLRAYRPRAADNNSRSGESTGFTRVGEGGYLDGKDQIARMMVASGTIFPVFPAHRFEDPTGDTESIEVVDGGFAHNIPIEPAVKWNATHLIVIEASPAVSLRQKDTLMRNLGVAFDHLFTQAQINDLRSRNKVEVYVLRPEHPILSTLDFIPALTEKALSQGELDALAGRFHQYSRNPKFWRIENVNNEQRKVYIEAE